MSGECEKCNEHTLECMCKPLSRRHENGDDFFKVIVWPEGVTNDQKKYLEGFLRSQSEEKTRLCVIYNPSCGCAVDQFVLLDRFPMSEKIISSCPVCKKRCYMEISDPIKFHLPLLEEDYSLMDLKNMIVTEGPQKHLIEAYKQMAENE